MRSVSSRIWTRVAVSNSYDDNHYTIIKINQNTEKSPRDPTRIAVTKRPVRNHQLTLVWKTLKIVKYKVKENVTSSNNSLYK